MKASLCCRDDLPVEARTTRKPKVKTWDSQRKWLWQKGAEPVTALPRPGTEGRWVSRHTRGDENAGRAIRQEGGCLTLRAEQSSAVRSVEQRRLGSGATPSDLQFQLSLWQLCGKWAVGS